jgi:hypothetical protein
MKSAFWRSIAVVALVAVPMMANANDATIGSEVAHNAMNGASLMNTTAIFNAFPHLVVLNGDGVELDAADGSGSGRVWYEASEGWWAHMTVGRGDLGLQGTNYMWGGNNFAPVISPSDYFTTALGFGAGAFPAGDFTREGAPFDDAMFLNFGVARPTSGGGAWALNLQLAPFGTQKLETGDPVTSDLEYNRSGYGAQLSWGNGNGLHLSGEFAMQKDELTDNLDDQAYGDVSLVDFGVNARWDRNAYIYQGNFVYAGSTTSGNATGSQDATDNLMGVMLSAGRYLKNDVDGQATLEAGLQWASTTDDDGSQPAEEEKFSGFAIPTLRTAVWQMISDRWGLMGGVSWGFAFTTDEDDGVPDKATDNFSSFDWSAGLFFQPSDTVRLDARLEEDNLNSLLNLGNQNDLLVYIGATVGLN